MSSKAFKSIKRLIYSKDLTETEKVKRLKAILTTNPDVVNETNDQGVTLLNYAALHQSVEFCRLLAEGNLEAARTPDDYACLPIHNACWSHNLEVTKYLFTLYPEGINVSGEDGKYPIHCIFPINQLFWDDDDYDDDRARFKKETLVEFTTFLLEHDKGAVSSADDDGYLPLHLACKFDTKLSIVAAIYHAYPEAIFTETPAGYTPLDLAVRCKHDEIASFLQSQLELIDEAREDTEPDFHGDLPIHRALRSVDLPAVGTIELMLAANPASVLTANSLNMLPIHIACLSGNLEIVKCLNDANEDSLWLHDSMKNYPLHIACLAGKHDVINYILGKSDYHKVSEPNINGKLPIQLLLYRAKCERDSLDYMNAVYSLLRAYPELIPFLGESD